jgi:LytS/YehU family sensor histidine kinase
MIGSLAEEFRLLSEISDRRMIPMRDELRSCRLHLDLMSGRKGRRYELVTEGVDPEALVPPSIFHTLVENALTHGGARAETTLILRARRDGASVHYTFDAPRGAQPAADPPIEERPVEERPVEEKTGLRYVRARLRESFGGDWSLRHGPVQGLWRTEIAMPEVRA